MAGTPQGSFGIVESIWRYPVKSMRGEELDAADVTERGLVGDRGYALLDPVTGRVASAKNPRKWASLFDCQAVYTEEPRCDASLPPVRIMLPDGETITSAQNDRDAALTRVFGRETTLITTPPDAGAYEAYWPAMQGVMPVGEPLPSAEGETMTVLPVAFAAPKETFFDVTVIHLLTTATLRRLRDLYPEGNFDVRRFRPNIVVDIPEAEPGFVENDWVGGTLAIGDALRLQIMLPCPRCVMPTLSQGNDLPRDVGILRAIARNNQVPVGDMGNMGCAGVYAAVVSSGTIRYGDAVRLV